MTDLTENLEQHHRYSASGADGWMTCSGKNVMEEGIEDTYSPYADEGSAAHFLASECLSKNRTPESYHHFGIVCWEKKGDRDGQCWSAEALPEGAVQRSIWKVDTDMVNYITSFVDYVKEIQGKGTLLVEQRVHFGNFIGMPGAFGTGDVIVLSEDGTELTIIDLKYGFKEVSAKENKQMMCYALGALDDHYFKKADVYETELSLEDLC